MTASDTRQLLIDAATRAFAEHGVHNASLLEITRQAGQRNRGAVHYHFGSREGMLVAVLEREAEFLGPRERELLAVAQGTPDDDLASVFEAVVRPSVELAETGWRGRCFLQIVAQLVDEEAGGAETAVQEALGRSGGYEVYELLHQRLPEMSEQIRDERMALATTFLLRSIADRARAGDREGPGRTQLSTEDFIRNLISMVTAMVTAPA
ncbi:TetR family transcriptional regulator [Nocardioides lianchengensis]|uniref:Regulatory protein, tetR family n=1 Tax=Nocardioides lianchengensis TaxID=1045774 RepID=A0A1G6J2F5_9ACTN|nr:TetR family transcriptional regulator [Nocardioides lianchengensis]NYG12878.1 AcrR family transcriptional regulator [Nocardioides lianchengensis]SDC12830.1 regulatory protein, tetR family [Nocardioides lianchengensis]